ncbi:MAG: response regulator, partial [Planctomycetes bacterium]|nr:response regulator [Planctomycetota bacterium]
MNASRQSPATASTKTHKILVVDDTQDNLDLMVEVLEDGPWTVVTARDAESALSQASETAFDLFLLDVHMPDVDGFELCRRLRREPDTQNIPVIFVTAERTSTASVIEGLDAGGFDYVTKPLDRAELLARIRVMLRLRTAERRLLAAQGVLVEQNQ